MKKFILLSFLVSFSLSGQKENQGRVVSLDLLDTPAFKTGEYLKYELDYGIISAGYAELSIKKMAKKQGRWTYHMSGFGRSTGVTEWAFRTRDYYDTYISEKTIKPVEFIRNVDEGGYKINRHIIFNHEDETAKDLKFDKDSLISIKPNSQDLLSSFYYLRCLDATKLKTGDKIAMTIFMDHENYPFQLKYLGKEVVEIPKGKIRCLKFIPVVQDGRVFRDEESVTLWVSDDKNKVPIYIKSKLKIGSVKMRLTEYKNLKAPLKFKN